MWDDMYGLFTLYEVVTMRYFIVINNGYIEMVGYGYDGEEITKEQHDHISSIINACPIAPDGYTYLLRTDLTWELVELPPELSPEATEADYKNGLSKMGVNV